MQYDRFDRFVFVTLHFDFALQHIVYLALPGRMAKKKGGGPSTKAAAKAEKKQKAAQKTERKEKKKAGKNKDEFADDDQDLEAILEQVRNDASMCRTCLTMGVLLSAVDATRLGGCS